MYKNLYVIMAHGSMVRWEPITFNLGLNSSIIFMTDIGNSIKTNSKVEERLLDFCRKGNDIMDNNKLSEEGIKLENYFKENVDNKIKFINNDNIIYDMDLFFTRPRVGNENRDCIFLFNNENGEIIENNITEKVMNCIRREEKNKRITTLSNLIKLLGSGRYIIYACRNVFNLESEIGDIINYKYENLLNYKKDVNIIIIIKKICNNISEKEINILMKNKYYYYNKINNKRLGNKIENDNITNIFIKNLIKDELNYICKKKIFNIIIELVLNAINFNKKRIGYINIDKIVEKQLNKRIK
jgi:hypothetical protein